MKTIVVVVSGAAGPPVDALAHRTALQAARAHHATTLALRGSSGWIDAGDEAHRRPLSRLAICLGVDRGVAEPWRAGPVEAAGIGWDLPPASRIYRGTLVTLEGEQVCDRLAGKITMAETEALAECVAGALAGDGVDCRATGPGVTALALTRPGDEENPPLDDLRARAHAALRDHGVNSVRLDLGENPANGLLLSDGGLVAAPLTPADRPPAAILSGSQEGRGLAALTGAVLYPLDDVWGDERHPWRIRPDLIEGFRKWRHVVVDLRVPAPDAADSAEAMVSVVRAVDFLDQVVLGPLFAVLEAFRPARILLVAAAAEGVEMPPALFRFPAVLAGDGIRADGVERWDEDACVEGGLGGMKLAHFMSEMMEAYREPWPLS